MSLLKLVPPDHPALWRKALKVTFAPKEVYPHLPEMRDILRANRALGLSAPQVGLRLRFFIRDTDSMFWLAINPTWKPVEGSPKETLVEGCLSNPGFAAEVPRWLKIATFFELKDGRKMHEPLEGVAARVWQHECDHLDGINIFPKP